MSKDNLKALIAGKYHFISRFPRRFNLEKKLVSRAWEEGQWQSLGTFSDARDAARYRVCSYDHELYGHEYHFVVVHSSKLDGRKTKSIDRRLNKEEERLSKALAEFQKRRFACEPDAHEAWEVFVREHGDDHFILDHQVQVMKQRKKRDRPGRPPKDYVPQYEEEYQVNATMRRDPDRIRQEKEKASCFVLISRLPCNEDITDEYILKTYKEQSVVERHFAFIKDPRVVGPVYMKKPERVEALAYVFLMALLVFSVLQRRVRLAMQDETEPLILHGNVKSFKPTGQRILQLLSHMLVIKGPDGTRELPDNTPVPRRLLILLSLPQDVFTRVPET